MIGRIKIDQADRLWSLYVRTRAGWKCQRCSRQYQEGERGLENSHFFGRRNEATRFDGENCWSLCTGCHGYFTANPHDHRDWVLSKLGKPRYDLLVLKANSYHKKDRKMSLIIVRELFKKDFPKEYERLK